jgi:hypothetical protein
MIGTKESSMESSLLKPAEMTPAGVAKLIERGLAREEYQSGAGPQKALAQHARVAPQLISDILHGRFPGEPKKTKGYRRSRPVNIRKHIAGRTQALTRLCDTLGLDLDACIEACGLLPKDEAAITRARGNGPTPLQYGKDDFEMLAKQVDLLGPISHHLIPTLVAAYRRNLMKPSGGETE